MSRGCESPNHAPSSCWGELRRCPVCGTRICYADGAADDGDDQTPGVCDTCVHEGAEVRR